MARGGDELKPPRLSWTYHAFLIGSHVVPLVPRRLAYLLADRIGDLFWLFNAPARRTVRDNLSRVLARRPPWRTVRAAFHHGTRNYYDTLVIPRLSDAALLDLVRVADWSSLDRALAAGRGAIMVGVHLSSVALAGQVVAAKGYPVVSVAERVEPPELNALLVRLRSAGGVRILSLGPDLMRDLIATLRRNEVVGLVMDRDVSGTGIDVQFFGAPASLPSGPALLALRTGAPLLPAIAIRRADDRFAGFIEAAVSAEPGADVRDRIRRTTRRIAERFEPYIAAHPEQWTVYQPIWVPPAGPTGRGGRS